MNAVEYYKLKFGEDRTKGFVHLVKEMGELAGSMEKGLDDIAKYELAEVAGICQYLASTYGIFDFNTEIEKLYVQKLQKLQNPSK